MRIMMRTLLTLCLGCCALAALFPVLIVPLTDLGGLFTRPELAGEDPRSRRLEAVGVVLGNFAVVFHE